MKQALGKALGYLSSALLQSRVSAPSRDSGSQRGTINGWRPRRVASSAEESRERGLTMDRAADLYVNDFAAHSAVDVLTVNSVGTGLIPQPRIPWQLLGISKEEARMIKERMEWNWAIWCRQAHYGRSMQFEDLQFLAVKSLVRLGEFLHVPVMDEPDPVGGRSYSLAIQPLDPRRLSTPLDLVSNPLIRDGVQFSPTGIPLGYWIAAPASSIAGYSSLSGENLSMSSAGFRYIPARVGHRPGIFHIFRHDEEEQARGVSVLSAGVKLFRNLADSIDYELYAQILAASFPVFIGLEEAGAGGLTAQMREQMGLEEEMDESGRREDVQGISYGQVIYGRKGEKPEVLESKRPGTTFAPFTELILRAQGASMGLPYELVLKDFSKSNYSSTRAALNEAWKLFQLYRSFFSRRYCQPLWEMVQEEAWLRGELELPPHAPDFYAALPYWCNVYWYGPSRGYIDPLKEIQANVMAISNRLMTRTAHWAQQGEDFDEGMDSIRAEEERLATMPDVGQAIFLHKNSGTGTKVEVDDE